MIKEDFKRIVMEDYKHKYEQALSKARKLKEENPELWNSSSCIIRDFFPELREESGDKRISKEIISYLKTSTCIIPENKYQQWIAWLEKQKGIKEYGYTAISEVNGIVRDINFIDFDTTGTSMQIPLENHTLKSGDKVKVTINKFETQGEQKPADTSEIERKSHNEGYVKGVHDAYDNVNQARSILNQLRKERPKPVGWSEDDEKLYQSALWHIKNSCGNQGKTSGEYEVYHFVKSLKDRVLPQPQEEWSEEDEYMLKVVKNLTLAGYKDYPHPDIPTLEVIKNWLKSLRPQKQWKPSEEQMEALELASRQIELYDCQEALESLYEQLKAL